MVLPQYIEIGLDKDIPSTTSSHLNLTILVVVNVIVQYSASAEEQATIVCFLEMRESLRKRQKPMVDLQSISPT